MKEVQNQSKCKVVLAFGFGITNMAFKFGKCQQIADFVLVSV